MCCLNYIDTAPPTYCIVLEGVIAVLIIVLLIALIRGVWNMGSKEQSL